MIREITTERIPIKLWLDDIEEGALEQAKNIANLPFAFRHIAIMPDSHLGYGMPIGAILATKGHILPNAVGVDIGCGMVATRTNIKEIKNLRHIMGRIRQAIPVGFNWHKEKQGMDLIPKITDDLRIVNKNIGVALKQVGTLGGGNHFIEIQKDQEGFIWIMIHSGSRRLGKEIAEYYDNIAKEKWGDRGDDLAFLPIDSEEGQDYIKEMNYALDYAYANRQVMLNKMKDIFNCSDEIRYTEEVNIAHNFATEEEHFGEKVWVHRKGATEAFKDTIGIIPGSQGTKSYIVKGKGNPDSFMSCSHGAGRKMSRNKARKELNVKKEIDKLNKLGVIHAIRGEKDLDEAPSAYKDINEVMDNQKDLVDVLYELKPLAVIKG